MAGMSHPRRPPGRPRRPDTDREVLEATLDAFIEDGYAGLSVEGVAERVGVAKTTIYRRWPSKQELVLAAILSLFEEWEVPDTGDLEADLITVVRQAHHTITRTRAGRILPRMAGEVTDGTPLGRAYLEGVMQPRFLVARRLLARAVDRGELRRDLDVDLAVASIIGPMMFLFITARLPAMGDDLPERLVRHAIQGLGPLSGPSLGSHA